MSERGPVQFNVPRDNFYGEADYEIGQPRKITQGAGSDESLDQAADLLASVYEEHKDRIYTDPSTGEPVPVPGALQLVFCDFGTPSEKWNPLRTPAFDTKPWTCATPKSGAGNASPAETHRRRRFEPVSLAKAGSASTAA